MQGLLHIQAEVRSTLPCKLCHIQLRPVQSCTISPNQSYPRVLQAEREASNGQASTSQAAEPPKPRQYSPEETAYSQHQWNINNLPRCKV